MSYDDLKRRALDAEDKAEDVRVLSQGVVPNITGAPVETALGRGLDIGTANILCAVRNPSNAITVRCERNAFLDLQADVHCKSMLTKLKVPYVVYNDKLVVIGDAAFDLANVFSRETRRPMRDGLISPSEVDALPMIQLIIKKVLGEASVEGEPVYFSVPGESIDASNNIIYHQGLFDGMLRNLGYEPTPLNEGHAVIFAELASDDFTGIGISFGGGMVNVCVAYKTIPALTFSIARGGDWIDRNVGQVLGINASRATFLKESGVDLRHPRGREQEAINIYYRNLLSYTINQIKARFQGSDGMPVFREPVAIVCAGGSTLIQGFEEVLREEFGKVKFPIPIREIRRVQEPLNSVCKGCLVAALSAAEEGD
ncbi:MAG: hypothetical protein AB1486_02570 [Planctomycetota bacterium]